MEAKKSIEINDRAPWDVDGWPHGVIGLLAVWNHDIEAVSRAPLKDDYQPLVANSSVDRGKRRARQETWDRGSTDNRKSAVAQKYSASNGHKTAPGFWLRPRVASSWPTTNDYNERKPTNDKTPLPSLKLRRSQQ